MLGFGLTICFELKNGKKVTFDGSGFQEATTNYFLEWASVSISPKQLASASSVEEMIGLLTRNVMDGDRPIFEKSNPIESEVVEDVFDAYDFINMIRENICSMSDISNIFIIKKNIMQCIFIESITLTHRLEITQPLFLEHRKRRKNILVKLWIKESFSLRIAKSAKLQKQQTCTLILILTMPFMDLRVVL